MNVIQFVRHRAWQAPCGCEGRSITLQSFPMRGSQSVWRPSVFKVRSCERFTRTVLNPNSTLCGKDIAGPHHLQARCCCHLIADHAAAPVLHISRTCRYSTVDNQDILQRIGASCSYCHKSSSSVVLRVADSTCLGCWACCLYAGSFPANYDECPSWYALLQAWLWTGH